MKSGTLSAHRDRSGDFVLNSLHFAKRLKERGLPVTLGRTLDALRGLMLIRLEDKEEAYSLFSAHYVSRPEELAVFDAVFKEFWCLKGPPDSSESAGRVQAKGSLPLIIPGEWERADDHAGHDRPAMSYSPQEILHKKDFADMIDRESEDVCQVIMALAQELGLRLGRRWRTRGKGTQVDLRGSIRASLRHGGELLALRKKRRQPKKTRFVVLCDVSGSMDSYSRFLLQFMYGFQRHVPRVETFVFSTRLTRITPHLRMRKIEAAYELISESVSHWSGGTRIGNSLAQYNKRYGRKYSGPNTVFVLLSDGWDQGATALLEREMKELRRRVKRLMWLNPLLGMPDYRPIDRGMRTALPHVEDFLDCHNLDELEAFGRKLEKV
ncbi:MAG: VWA domain-containing protein [Pseudomonadota bacterium]